MDRLMVTNQYVFAMSCQEQSSNHGVRTLPGIGSPCFPSVGSHFLTTDAADVEMQGDLGSLKGL